MTQEEALTILKTGANVFLTGEPGSGKTHTVNRYIEYLERAGVDPAVTASTGIAATHVGGMTIHSWSGIGIRSRLTEADIDALSEKEKLVKRLNAAKVLIIDEISMLSRDTLTSVEAVCRHLRRRSDAFGGLQVVFVGDFFQLPPIERRDNFENDSQEIFFDEERPQTNFAYGSMAWKRAKPLVCYLTEQHRQEDGAFLDLLATLRRGEKTQTMRDLLKERSLVPPESGLTKLFPKNANVDQINVGELRKLPGYEKQYTMTSVGYAPIVEGLKKNCLSPEVLALKIGAKVMFTKNHLEGKYVNGTLGEVIDFSKTNGLPLIKTRNGRTIEVSQAEWVIQDGQKIIASIEQLPLRLAWAITVHKSQGMSLDAAVVDLTLAFEFGQGYVALSRVRTLEGLFLHGFNERALEVHPDVLLEDAVFRQSSDEAEAAFSSMDEKEIETMQKDFLRAIGGSLQNKERPKKGSKKESTYELTKRLVKEKKTIDEMAEVREVTRETIVSHLEKLVLEGELDKEKDLAHVMPNSERFEVMKAAFLKTKTKEGMMNLSPARRATGDDYSFEELRLARIFI